jgi:hypothetical protein
MSQAEPTVKKTAELIGNIFGHLRARDPKMHGLTNEAAVEVMTARAVRIAAEHGIERQKGFKMLCYVNGLPIGPVIAEAFETIMSTATEQPTPPS